MKNNRAIEYQLTKRAFDSMLEMRNDEEKKQNPYQYVMSIINKEYGLRGTVTGLSII